MLELLLFIKLVSEYAEHTKDFALINEIKDVLDKIMGGFDKLVEENGKGVVNISTIKNARTETVNMFPRMEKEAEIFKLPFKIR